MEHLKGALVDWKGLPGTNTVAYYENLQITSVKSFVGLALGCGKTGMYIIELCSSGQIS